MTEDNFKLLVGMKGDLQVAVDWWGYSHRLGFVLLFQFQIENLFKNILRQLGVPCPKKYYDIAEKILKEVSVPDHTQKHNYLMVSAYIRNSLHSNGIHSNANIKTDIDGLEYEFSKGRRVQCASWDHLIHAFNATITIIEEILSAPNILALEGPIPDEYVLQKTP